MPEMEEGSMFLLLLTREEAKQNRGLFQQKLNVHQIDSQNLMWYVLEGREPTGWRIQSALFPHLDGRGLLPISAYRNRKHAEKIIVIFDLLPNLTPWFSQGATVSTIYEHFQESLLQFAEEIYKKHNRARPRTPQETTTLREQVAELKKVLDDLNDQGFFHREDHLRLRERLIALLDRLLKELNEKLQSFSHMHKKQTFRDWYAEHRWDFWMSSILAALLVGVVVSFLTGWLQPVNKAPTDIGVGQHSSWSSLD